MKSTVLVGLAAALCAASGASAVELYNNGGFNGANGYSGQNHNDFVLQSNSIVTHATMDVLSNFGNNNPPAGSLTWFISADNNGTRGNQLFTGTSAIVGTQFIQADAFGGYDIWRVTLDSFGNLNMNAGTYWYGFQTDNNSNVAFWGTANGGGYQNSPSEFAFTIQGIPAPGPAALMALGGLAALRRRR